MHLIVYGLCFSMVSVLACNFSMKLRCAIKIPGYLIARVMASTFIVVQPPLHGRCRIPLHDFEEEMAEIDVCEDSPKERGRDLKAARRIDAKGKDSWRPKPGHHSGALRSDGSRVGPSRDLSQEELEGCVQKLDLQSSPAFRARSAVPS